MSGERKFIVPRIAKNEFLRILKISKICMNMKNTKLELDLIPDS